MFHTTFKYFLKKTVMKKFLFLLLSCGLTTLSIAQSGLEIGLDIMPQTHWILNQNDFDEGGLLDHKPTYGVAIGAHAGLNFSDKFGAQIGILYSAQGQDYEQTVNDIVVNEYAKKLTYIKIPLLFKFNGDPDAGAYFQGVVGPQLGLLTNAEVEGNPPGTLLIPNSKDAYNSVDLSAVLGLGVGIKMTDALRLGLMFRFDVSLGDIENKDDFWTETIHFSRESSQNVTGGLMISLNYVLN